MKDFSQYKEIGKTTNTVTYTIEDDPDILIVVPLEGTMDNARDAQENVAFFYSCAHQLGRPVGCAVIMSNMLSQDAEARRAYAEINPKLVYGGALVVESALSRALGSFFVGLSRPVVPTKLFDSIEKAIEWLKSVRPK
jgi:hypothetical protein